MQFPITERESICCSEALLILKSLTDSIRPNELLSNIWKSFVFTRIVSYACPPPLKSTGKAVGLIILISEPAAFQVKPAGFIVQFEPEKFTTLFERLIFLVFVVVLRKSKHVIV